MKKIVWLKVIIFLACLAPLVYLTWALLQDNLGANPIEALTRRSGEWALRFLLITLSMTPVQKLLKQSWPIKFRRMLGLYTFFYASLHMLTYVWLDQFFAWDDILVDIIKRPFILVGTLAFILLIPLAITSTKAMMRKLGRNWKRLHQLVYPIACFAILHFYWLVKKDTFTPSIYLSILVVLLAYRLFLVWQRQQTFRRKSSVSGSLA